jgi:hypothetical protein
METVKIKYSSSDIFPIFLDYDFVNNRCRGISAKIDFFSYGTIDGILDTSNEKELEFIQNEGIFIRRSELLFSSGFFLFDFDYILNNKDKFVKKIKDSGITSLYFEKSKYFDLSPIFNELDWCEISLLEFDDAPHIQS